jgi:hypothetical protein
MTTETVHPHVVHPHAKVRRATKSSWVGLGVIVVLVLAAPAAPYVLDKGTQGSLVTLFSLIVMATMWNLLAGYGGMLSVGQHPTRWCTSPTPSASTRSWPFRSRWSSLV